MYKSSRSTVWTGGFLPGIKRNPSRETPTRGFLEQLGDTYYLRNTDSGGYDIYEVIDTDVDQQPSQV